MFIQTKW